MIPLPQVQRGLAAYIDSEFVNKLTDWRKWVVGAGAAMALQDFPAIVGHYKNNEVVKMLGIIDSNDNVDVDKLYNQFKAQAQKGAITFNLPMLGAVTLNEADVDKLYRFIVQGG